MSVFLSAGPLVKRDRCDRVWDVFFEVEHVGRPLPVVRRRVVRWRGHITELGHLSPDHQSMITVRDDPPRPAKLHEIHSWDIWLRGFEPD